MNRRLDSLDPIFRPMAAEFLARLVEATIPVLIINTRRTREEQIKLISDGRSWVRKSLHEQGLAIDICPYAQFNLHGSNKLEWDSSDPVWSRIGAIGEACLLRWGGRWRVKDLGHFEYPLRGDHAAQEDPTLQHSDSVPEPANAS